MVKNSTINQHPEQQTKDIIDEKLIQAGWLIQTVKAYNPNAGLGIAVREYPTGTGPVDYLLFVDREPVAIIEAKQENFAYKLNTIEEQSARYAKSELKNIAQADIAFLYESTGTITRFTNCNDPTPRAREVFNFHRPETLQKWATEGKNTLRAKLKALPVLNPQNLPACELNLRDCQLTAIENIQTSLAKDLPRALIQMATGAGKTYTAINIMYRLLKYTGKRRILFLVDTVNLGEQAEQEMLVFTPPDDNRKFTELYNTQVIKSPHIPKGVEVCICTIQRMYSLLKGEDVAIPDDSVELEEWENRLKEPLSVAYQPNLPPEFFDFIFIDECHRSIYNLWRQVLDYFDAYLIGLTATPDNRTFGFFNQNVVSEYSHEQAVADGVNVGNEVFLINTKISIQGGKFKAEELVEYRERTTRRKRWQQQDTDESYTAKQLDRDIVNPSQIRTIIRTFRDHLPIIFPNRQEVPKTLIFAQNDSHADDIIKMVREEFGQGNEFCKKITYKAKDDILDENGDIVEQGEEPKTILANFRNSYHPRIAVTVDMIATGTDVRPLECLLFMRDVKSRNYFEQMKGRGTRTLDKDGLQKVSPPAPSAKTHYVIVDAIGVTKSLKTSSIQLDTKRSVSFAELGRAVVFGGAFDMDSISSLACRLSRLDKQLSQDEQQQISEILGGVALSQVVKDLFHAINADEIHKHACEQEGISLDETPSEETLLKVQKQRVRTATKTLSMELITALDEIRKQHEQKIDHELDEVTHVGWAENDEAITQNFADWINEHKDGITALQIFYNQPYQRQAFTLAMIKELANAIKKAKPKLAFSHIWQAYARLDQVSEQKQNELTALVGLIRRVVGIDNKITPFAHIVRKNFQKWTFEHNARADKKLTEEQMAWLAMIKEHIITSFSIKSDDFELTPFNQHGGLGQAYDVLCGITQNDDFDALLDEINQRWTA
ncbi:type I restriction endonuclease subunit R [Histophilus somni]|uniref:type I restriction endonuclease subunit R n=1 Tax=Histophilus somni TaxID=731 RepID=UPI0000397161|nr:DEAD/DEAH box helicase family protein [Histophilus somni]ACA32131.1 type III restriction protein res subunit [Histophilus somni 2336]